MRQVLQVQISLCCPSRGTAIRHDRTRSNQKAVKDLLIGSSNNTGIFTKVEDLVESSLQSVSGYFATSDNTYTKKTREIERKIVNATKDIEKYRARLEAKFSAMDMLIAQMQQQYSSFLTT